MLAVKTNQRRQTSIYAGVVDLLGGGVKLADDNRAGTATAFAAASVVRHVSTFTAVLNQYAMRIIYLQLRSRETNATEVLQNSDLGVDVVKDDFGPVEIEPQGIVKLARQSRQRLRLSIPLR